MGATSNKSTQSKRRKRRIRSPHPGVVLLKRTLPSGAVSWRARYPEPDTGRTEYLTLDRTALPTAEARRYGRSRKQRCSPSVGWSWKQARRNKPALRSTMRSPTSSPHAKTAFGRPPLLHTALASIASSGGRTSKASRRRRNWFRRSLPGSATGSSATPGAPPCPAASVVLAVPRGRCALTRRRTATSPRSK